MACMFLHEINPLINVRQKRLKQIDASASDMNIKINQHFVQFTEDLQHMCAGGGVTEEVWSVINHT